MEASLRIVAGFLVTCFDFDWPSDLIQSFLRQGLETYCLKVEGPSQTFLNLSLYDYLREVRYCCGTLSDSDVRVLAGLIYRRWDDTPSVRFRERDFLRSRNVFFVEHELQLGCSNDFLFDRVFSTCKRSLDFILTLAFKIERPQLHVGYFNGIEYAHSHCIRPLISQVTANPT